MEKFPSFDLASMDRRQLFKLSLFAGVAGMLPSLPVFAQEAGESVEPPVSSHPVPVVDARFPSEIAPGVFILPDKRITLVPNVGIIVGRDSVLVVDCGLGIESAENVLDVVRRLASGRKIILTVTHAHPEHGFGAQVFRSDARIYYNSAQRDHLTQRGDILLNGFRNGVLPPEQAHLLDDVVLTRPHETYDGAQARIDLGGRMVEMRTWGTAHTPGDQIIYLPDDGIVFAGDLLEERMFPIVPFFPPMIEAEEIDIARWETVLRDIIGLAPKMIVPGHGNLAGTELPKAVLAYFADIRQRVQSATNDPTALERQIRRQYASWENPHFVEPTLRYFMQAG